MIGELLSADPAAVGPYRLVGRLGTGGMGQVFLGQSPGGRLVAVKVIRPELAGEPGFRRRFAREVTAARNVSGLFTALVVNADPDAAMPWLATAYVAGPSLAEAVEEHGVLPARSVTGLAAGLAEGLEALGFAPNKITWRAECYTGAHPADQVQTQSPAAGASVPKTQLISLGVEADNCTS
jgi:eukaryotic-like serine/threonine-protein kinase